MTRPFYWGTRIANGNPDRGRGALASRSAATDAATVASFLEL